MNTKECKFFVSYLKLVARFSFEIFVFYLNIQYLYPFHVIFKYEVNIKQTRFANTYFITIRTWTAGKKFDLVF